MIEGGVGGANTRTGLEFERRSDFLHLLADVPGYEIAPHENGVGVWILYQKNKVARSFRKHAFYKYLDEVGVKYQDLISKKLLPDDALLVLVRETLFIIEVKYQQVSGSVDEKLQTCDYKRKFYCRLLMPIGIKVEYVYVLNRSWFGKPEYRDVLEYICSVNCHYHFDRLPLAWLGLPDGRDLRNAELGT